MMNFVFFSIAVLGFLFSIIGFCVTPIPEVKALTMIAIALFLACAIAAWNLA